MTTSDDSAGEPVPVLVPPPDCGPADLPGGLLITGAAVRLGRAIALDQSRRGRAVAIHYGQSRDEAEQTVRDCLDAGAPQAVAVQGDLRQTDDCRRVVGEAFETLGPLSVLVNSAAIFEPGTLTTTDASNWTRHLDINLAAPMWLSQAFVEGVQASGGPSAPTTQIINIVDWRGERHPDGHLAYTVSKAGLIALSRLLAQELGPDTRVNAIAPGPVLPPPGQTQDYLDRVASSLPLRRAGSPDDIARAAAYLIDAPFVTGDVLHVTGGQEFARDRG